MRTVATTAFIVLAVGVGCGNSTGPAAPLVPATEVSAADAPVTHEHSDAAFDGIVTDSEAAQAADLVRSDPVASELLDRYGGILTAWRPAELEGEPRGASAWIEFDEPITMTQTVIRNDSEVPPTRVEDYVLVTVQLKDEVVDRYGVVVDLATMTVVVLAPSPR